jgi:hypothetical protein
LSHAFKKIYRKRKDLENIGNAVGLKSNCEKTKSLRINIKCNKKFQTRWENVEEIEKFTFVGSKITRW